MKRILILTAATAVLALTALAGSTPVQPHEVILIASEQDWGPVGAAAGYPATIYACTRSSGAPVCRIGDNTAQVIADLLSAGYVARPELGNAIAFGVVFVK